MLCISAQLESSCRRSLIKLVVVRGVHAPALQS
jgi:hypothetical protein